MSATGGRAQGVPPATDARAMQAAREPAADHRDAWREYRRGRLLPLFALVAGGAWVLASGHWPAMARYNTLVAGAAAAAMLVARWRLRRHQARLACPRCGERFHGDSTAGNLLRSAQRPACAHCGLALFGTD